MTHSTPRRGFTLLEVVLATAISATVAGVCLGLFFFFNSADARLQERFLENEQLSRLRLVSERAFQSLLISEKPQSLKDAEVRVRKPSTNNSRPPGLPIPEGETLSTNQEKIDLKNHPEIIALREQIPPRLELLMLTEESVETPTSRDAADGSSTIRAQRFTNVPQRLELLLTKSPVPTYSELDDPEALMERVKDQRAREKQQLRRRAVANESAEPEDQAAAAEDEEAVEDFESPMRALRGAFEMRPMVAVGEGTSAEARGWEVWWVPLPREAGPDEIPDLEEPILDEPFQVAKDIAFLEWRIFQGRERRSEFVGRLQDDIPAYIEVEAETVGGLKANWLFEIDWTMGHESQPKPVTPAVTGATNPDGTPATNPDGTPVTPAPTTPVDPNQPGAKPVDKPEVITPSQPGPTPGIIPGKPGSIKPRERPQSQQPQKPIDLQKPGTNRPKKKGET